MIIKNILLSASNEELSEKILESFGNVQKNYALEKHRYSGLEAGHFVESIRRLIELKLFGTHTPLSDSLPRFNDAEIVRYMQATGNDSYKILIPRALFSIYTLRNRRGIGHASSVEASMIDTSYILNACKWVLAEIVRLESGLSPDDCEDLISKILTREIPVMWKTSEFKTIISPLFNVKERCLIYLLDEDGLSLDELQGLLQYKNLSRLKKYIQDLNKVGFIHVHEEKIYLSPFGQIEAEKLVSTNLWQK